MFRAALLTGVALIAGCFPSSTISDVNFSSEYKGDGKTIHPELSIFQYAPDSARLYVQLNTDELLFTKQHEDTFRATFQLFVRIVDSYQSPMERDTARKTFHVNKTAAGTGKHIYHIEFHLPDEGEYMLECSVLDSTKKVIETDYITLNKTSAQSHQNFFIHAPGASTPFFTSYLSAADTFSINYRNDPPQPLYVSLYKQDFPIAVPPYSYNLREKFNYTADSTFTIQSGGANKYCFVSKGIYHLQRDTTNHNGATIYRYAPGFPQVTTPEELIKPLKYITSKKEYEELSTAQNKKQAVDKFWLDNGKSQDRSRELIKKFYSRVEKANRLFTSYMEGWKTDRGMVCLIFGNPNVVYKSSDGEAWTYGEVNSAQSITFNFVKVNNPFTDNDYILNRYPAYESDWYHAVDTWRQGRVYNDF